MDDVLIVEDTPALQRWLVRQVEGLWPDSRVRAVSNSRSAFTELSDCAPGLVLLDLSIPTTDCGSSYAGMRTP